MKKKGLKKAKEKEFVAMEVVHPIQPGLMLGILSMLLLFL